MSIYKGLIIIVSFAFAAMCGDSTEQSGAVSQDKNWSKTVKAGKFIFIYRVDGTNLVAKVSYPTEGWVGVGFNPFKMMMGANFILGTIVGGKGMVSDEFGDSKSSHVPDTTNGGENDIISGHVVMDKGMMILSFVIPLNSGDVKDVALENGKKITVIFAAGKKPDLKSQHSDLEKTTIMLP